MSVSWSLCLHVSVSWSLCLHVSLSWSLCFTRVCELVAVFTRVCELVAVFTRVCELVAVFTRVCELVATCQCHRGDCVGSQQDQEVGAALSYPSTPQPLSFGLRRSHTGHSEWERLKLPVILAVLSGVSTQLSPVPQQLSPLGWAEGAGGGCLTPVMV